MVEYLLENGLIFLGTLKIKVLLQFSVKNNKLVSERFMSDFQYDKSLVLIATKRKKVVLVLSKKHNSKEVDEDISKLLQL